MFMNFQFLKVHLASYVWILALFATVRAGSQTITGDFSALTSQPIRLVGFQGFDTYEIDSAVVDEKGGFTFSYGKKDYGMGFLTTPDAKQFMLILSGENIELKGSGLALPESIEVVSDKENILFEKYADEHTRREQTMSAWYYLEKIYRLDSLFAIHDAPNQTIALEKKRIKEEDSLFLASLPRNTFVRWYLPVRKLISSAYVIAQYRTEEIPATIAAFRALDYTDARLRKSGLLQDALESHVWLIENSGRSLDSVYIEMQTSIDCILGKIKSDAKTLNEISEHLFNLLEKRSLFPASEYLALKLLQDKSCTIEKDFAAQLESYRAMKKGNTAPDIELSGYVIAPGYKTENTPRRLSDINSRYTVVIFGASWCPQCPVELSQIVRSYPVWQAHNVEVVFVSLDENQNSFQSFARVFPFISVCDYKKWESPVVKNYHVFATPTIFLLDNTLKILLRPNSAGQLDSWVDWYLVKGNK
jgi:thiol-disulfide isomerase/thioredoxin